MLATNGRDPPRAHECNSGDVAPSVLLTVIAMTFRAAGAALVLGVTTVVLLGVEGPGVIAGVGHLLTAVTLRTQLDHRDRQAVGTPTEPRP